MEKWTHVLTPLDNAFRMGLLPAITGHPHQMTWIAPSELPTRLGAWIRNSLPMTPCWQHKCSQSITRPLSDQIVNQNHDYSYETLKVQLQNKAQVRKDNKRKSRNGPDAIYQQLPQQLQLAMDLAKQKGVYSWLIAVPLSEHGSCCIELPSVMPSRSDMAGLDTYKHASNLCLWEALQCRICIVMLQR